jgi:hypothetical protein
MAPRDRRPCHWLGVILMSALAACGGATTSERQHAIAGASPGIGGRATGGSAGPNPVVGGSATSGGSGGTHFAAGSSAGGTSTGGATNASTGGASAGGSSAGGGGGASEAGGTSTGGAGASAGGAGACLDVCSLYGAPCCVPALGCVTPGGSCVIDVLAGGVDTTYEYADLEQKVAAMSPDVLLSMTDADFDWAAADPSASARFQLHMTPDASALHGSTLILHYPTHPFRVSCGGQSLFLGVMYLWYGQAALDTPVMDAVRDADDSLSLYLGAWEGAWVGLGTGPAGAKERIDRPELRAVFCQRGALKELGPGAMPPSP